MRGIMGLRLSESRKKKKIQTFEITGHTSHPATRSLQHRRDRDNGRVLNKNSLGFCKLKSTVCHSKDPQTRELELQI